MDVEVRFSPSGRRVRVPRGTTLLAAVQRAGLPLASACGADGLCGRCGVRLLRGGETLGPESADVLRVKARNRVDPSLRLACRAVLTDDVEVGAPYW